MKAFDSHDFASVTKVLLVGLIFVSRKRCALFGSYGKTPRFMVGKYFLAQFFPVKTCCTCNIVV